jgi:antitoxin component of MazEF toxin-antitoxin module
MARATVGRWGKNLAVRVPGDIAKAVRLSDGEHVEIEHRDGDILIRRPDAKARDRRRAAKAAREIIAESRNHSLGGISIRELIDEGRRG